MRRSLAIKVDYLEQSAQERIQLQSGQKLVAPWGLDENESLSTQPSFIPSRTAATRTNGGKVYLSPRGGFGQYLGRRSTFPNVPAPWDWTTASR